MRSRHFFTCSLFQVSKTQGHRFSSLGSSKRPQPPWQHRAGKRIGRAAASRHAAWLPQHRSSRQARASQATVSRREPSCPAGSIAAVTTPQNTLTLEHARADERTRAGHPATVAPTQANAQVAPPPSRLEQTCKPPHEKARVRGLPPRPGRAARGYCGRVRGRGPPRPLE